MQYLEEELYKIIASDESFRIERTTSKGAMDKFQVAICAFTNNMPGSGKKGYLLACRFSSSVRRASNRIPWFYICK